MKSSYFFKKKSRSIHFNIYVKSEEYSIEKSNVLQGYCIVATSLSQKEAIQWKVLVKIEWHMFLMEVIFTENWRGRNIYLYLVNCAGYFLLIISDPLHILLFALGD